MPGDVLGAKRKVPLRYPGGDDQQAVRHKDLKLHGNAWPERSVDFKVIFTQLKL